MKGQFKDRIQGREQAIVCVCLIELKSKSAEASYCKKQKDHNILQIIQCSSSPYELYHKANNRRSDKIYIALCRLKKEGCVIEQDEKVSSILVMFYLM